MITEPSTSGRAVSIPKVRVKKLKPAFERMVRGPVRRPAAIAEIENVASLQRARDLAALASGENGVTRVRKASCGSSTLLRFQLIPASSLRSGETRAPPFNVAVQTRPSPMLAVLGKPEKSMKSAWMSLHRV